MQNYMQRSFFIFCLGKAQRQFIVNPFVSSKDTVYDEEWTEQYQCLHLNHLRYYTESLAVQQQTCAFNSGSGVILKGYTRSEIDLLTAQQVS